MNKKFSELLDEYLDLRDKVKAEEKKGDMSNEWNDTYGFGQSVLFRRLKKAGRDLDAEINKFQT